MEHKHISLWKNIKHKSLEADLSFCCYREKKSTTKYLHTVWCGLGGVEYVYMYLFFVFYYFLITKVYVTCMKSYVFCDHCIVNIEQIEK